MKQYSIIFGVIFVLVVIYISASAYFKDTETCKSNLGIVKVGETKLNVEIANTDILRENGLSNHKNLNGNEGMIFVFENELTPSFWMKDMLFPINIIWIDKDLKIVGITDNIEPKSFPETFSPKEKIKYVLEVGVDSNINKENLIGNKITFECDM